MKIDESWRFFTKNAQKMRTFWRVHKIVVDFQQPACVLVCSLLLASIVVGGWGLGVRG